MSRRHDIGVALTEKLGRTKESKLQLEAAQSLQYLAAQWQRIHAAKRMLPYVLLTTGPTIEPCPHHAALHGLLLLVDDAYWLRAKLREDYERCRCSVRGVGRHEYQKLLTEGVPHNVRPDLSDAGRRTGRHITELRPPLLAVPTGY